MRTSFRGLVAATLLAGSAFAAAPALAQDSAVTFSGNAAVVTEYRFRGVDLSGGDIAIQGGIDAALPAGFYVGTWGSSIDEDTVGYGHTELDVYGGWSSEITDGITADVGLLAYLYPNAGPGDYDYLEVYGKLGFNLGPADTTVGVAYAPSQDSLGGTDNFYVYGDVSFGVPSTPVTVTGHLGYTDGFLTYTDSGNAWDYSIGAEVALSENLSAGLSWIGSEGDYLPGEYNFTDDAIVGTLSISF